jgi:hypothetical protein
LVGWLVTYRERTNRKQHTYNAFNSNRRLFKISRILYLRSEKPFPPQHPTPPCLMLTLPHPIHFLPSYSPLSFTVSQCFPQSRVWSGLLFSRKFIAIVSAMSAKPSLCNANPHRKSSSYNLDFKLDDVNRCKHISDRATDLVRAIWIPESKNSNIFNNIQVIDIHVLKRLKYSWVNRHTATYQQVTFETHWILGSNFCLNGRVGGIG